MKQPRKTHFRNASMLALLVSGVVFFTGCKKDMSSEDFNSTTPSVDSAEGSQSISAKVAITNEGFGSQATGGANSATVYHVTNLNSSGSGSLAGGIGSNRTIVFDVSGTISARFDLASISYLTIDASGQDITINGNNNGDAISFDGPNTHHCILKGVTVTNAGGDGINVVDGAHDILISNCSSYGNRDGNIDVAGDNSGVTKNITVQWCILGSGVGSDYSGCMLITGQNITAHHNLFVPAGANVVGERCPLVHCNYSPVGSPNADIRNNVVYKFGRNNATGSGYGTDVMYSATANVVNNYYYSPSDGGNAVVIDGSYGGAPKGSAYVSGNVSGNSGVNPNNQNSHAEYSIASQYAVTTQDACTAASLVLSQAGPRPLNSANQALVNTVSLANCSGGTTPPANQAPTANAGADKTITLPTSSVSLTGSGSDPDGSIASYAWTKVSGNGGTIASPAAATTNITGLTAGSYVFSLKVTDNKGATATDNVTVTVNAATQTNVPPTVGAGTNQTITLPVNSVTLSGSASDPDGSIVSYQWTKVSGTGGTINSPAAVTTSVSGLTAGSYTFSLKVTDNKGATATANVSVTVNAATQPGGGGFGTLTYSEGYDVASSVNTNQGRRNSVSTSTYLTGPGSFRSEVRAGDASQSGGFRSEMEYSATSQTPTEGVVEYNEYFENWSGFDGGGTNISWNPNTSGASAIVSLQTYAGKFDVVRALGTSVIHQTGTLQNISSNTWYKLRWEFKWSSGTDGYVRLYINDALYYSFTGKTADGSGQKLRVGQARWANTGNTMTVTSVCYYDNLKVYKK